LAEKRRRRSEHADYPRDPRQSTLYNWWKGEATKIGDLTVKISEIEKHLQEWEARSKTEKGDNIVNAISSTKLSGSSKVL